MSNYAPADRVIDLIELTYQTCNSLRGLRDKLSIEKKLKKVQECSQAKFFLVLDFRPSPSDPSSVIARSIDAIWTDDFVAALGSNDLIANLMRGRGQPVGRLQVYGNSPEATQQRIDAVLDRAGVEDFTFVPIFRNSVLIAGSGWFFVHAAKPSVSILVAGLLGPVVLETAERFSSGAQDDLPRVKLSRREIECLKWAAEGKTSWEIGAILSVGERTVHAHLARATRKLAAANRIQAVANAFRLGLIR